MKEHRVCNETGRKEGYSFVGEGTIHYSARSTNACAWVVRPSVVSLCICMCIGFPFNLILYYYIERKLLESALSTYFLLLSREREKRKKMEMRERENKRAWIRDQGRCHRGSSNARLLYVCMHVYVPLNAGMRLWACIYGNFAFSGNTIHVIGRCQSGGARCDVGDQFYRPSSHERV